MLFKRKSEIERRINNSIDELEAQIGNRSFYIIRNELKEYIIKNREKFKEAENSEEYKNFDSFRWVCGEVIFIGMSILGTGEYHVHRGVLNPMREGPEFQSIVLKTIDLLVTRNYYTEENRIDSQNDLKEAIRTVG